MFIDTTTPYPQHVHICLLCRSEEHFITLRAERPDKRVSGNPVGTTRKDWHTIEHEAKKARSRFATIRRLIQFQGTNANLVLLLFKLIAIPVHCGSQGIERRLPQFM